MPPTDQIVDDLKTLLKLVEQAATARQAAEANTATAVDIKAAEDADDVACKAVIEFILRVAGETFERRLLRAGQFERPEDLPPAGPDEADQRAARRIAARLLLDFRPLLPESEANIWDAILHDLLVARDLDPLVLAPPSSGRGKRHNRDLKATAEERIVRAVFQEAGRRGVPDTEVRRPLQVGVRGGRPLIDDRKWYRMRNRFSDAELEAFRDQGRALDQAPLDLDEGVLRALAKVAKS